MTEFITLPFINEEPIESEMKVHDTLKEAQKWAKEYLKLNPTHRVEITEF